MSDILEYKKVGEKVILQLNRPDKLNALGDEGDGDIFQAASARINADASVKAVILTGKGKAFSAGGNIKSMAERTYPFSGSAEDIADAYRNNIHKITKAIWNIGVPVIAAVNGAAVGLGNDITCLCDMRIASKNARFGSTFLKLGLIPGDGGAWILPRIIGQARAAELLYMGKIIDADTAYAWGLVSAITDEAALMAEASAIADAIAVHSIESLRATKRLLRQSEGSDYNTILEMSATTQAMLHKTEAHHKAVVAMLDKTSAKNKDKGS